VGALEIGANKRIGPGNGAIHVALCRKVHDRVDIVIRHDLRNQIGVTDISLDKVNALGLL